MKEFTTEEIADIKRALIIAMQISDTSGNSADVLFSDRLELIEKKINEM